MTPIEKLRVCCVQIIPQVYDNCLSTYESICRVADVVNEIIAYLNNFDDTTKQYIDSQISYLKNYVDAQDESITKNLTNLINKEISELEISFYKFRAKILNDINDFEYDINNKIEINEIIWENKFNDFKNDVLDLINQCDTICYNPTTGLYETVCKVINDIYNFTRIYAFTALEFDNSLVTVSEFDNSQITAEKFDTLGKTLLGKPRCNCYIRNPYNGLIQTLETVINFISHNNSQTLTANEYDTLSLTAISFDNYDLTAYDFDFEGKAILA